MKRTFAHLSCALNPYSGPETKAEALQSAREELAVEDNAVEDNAVEDNREDKNERTT